MNPPFRSARARVQVETRSQFFADRWRVNRSRTLVRDNCDLLPFPSIRMTPLFALEVVLCGR